MTAYAYTLDPAIRTEMSKDTPFTLRLIEHFANTTLSTTPIKSCVKSHFNTVQAGNVSVIIHENHVSTFSNQFHEERHAVVDAIGKVADLIEECGIENLKAQYPDLTQG